MSDRTMIKDEDFTTEDFISVEAELGAQNYKPLDVVIEKGEGVWVWDTEGRKYMDCLAAYSAVNQGHLPPENPRGHDRAILKDLPNIPRVPQ